MAERTITVEVIHAGAGDVSCRRIALPAGATVADAIEASGISEALPADAIEGTRVGVFGRKATLDQMLEEGDRVEIYRPLLLDPMEARRRRAR